MQKKSTYNQIDALCKYISLYKRKIDRIELETVFKSSPFYPSLLSIYHSLVFCGIHAVAVRAQHENLYTLNRPSLLHIKDDDSEYFLLAKCCDKEHIICYDTQRSQFVKQNSDKLFSKWDGIMIYTEQQQYHSQKKLFWALSVFATIVFCFHWDSFLFSTNLWGFFLSILLLLHEHEIKTSIVEGVCKVGESFDCNKVTHSKASRIIGVPLSVWGCLYFFSMILFLLVSRFSSIPQTEVTDYVQVICLGSLPILVYSVTKQFQLRTWCILCLSIVTILSFEAVILILWNELFAYSITIQSVLLHLFCVVLAGTFISLLVKGIELYKKYVSLRTRDLTIKRNPVIIKQLFRGTELLDKTDESYLSLGNTQASIVITTWISPYCNHCAKLIKDMLDLYNRHYENFEWRIYISGNASGELEKNKIQHTLITWYMKDKLLFLKALKKWFIHKEFIPVNEKSIQFSNEIEHQLKKQIQFTCDMKINSYPKCFINGLELPATYTLKDIYFMINDVEIWQNIKPVIY